MISGSTSGIGKATAILFKSYGATVCATGRNQSVLKELERDFGITIIAGDLNEKGEVKRIVEFAAKELKGLTTVINCAGVIKSAAFGTEECNLENYEYNFKSNTQSVFEMMIHSIPFLKLNPPSESPSIVNVSSVNAQTSFANVGSYCASKAAVDMYTKCAALDLAPFGIRVNAVNPGVVTSNLQKRGGLSDENYQTFIARSIDYAHPLAKALNRVATPEEVAELIAFLASNKASYITGDCIRIDGGRFCLGAR